MDSDETKKTAEKRINIIKGQLNGLYRMINEGEYCIDILNQSLAIQNSLKSLDNLILEKHLCTHVADLFRSDKARAVKELLKLYKKA